MPSRWVASFLDLAQVNGTYGKSLVPGSGQDQAQNAITQVKSTSIH
jgi:hypothetical protein